MRWGAISPKIENLQHKAGLEYSEEKKKSQLSCANTEPQGSRQSHEENDTSCRRPTEKGWLGQLHALSSCLGLQGDGCAGRAGQRVGSRVPRCLAQSRARITATLAADAAEVWVDLASGAALKRQSGHSPSHNGTSPPQAARDQNQPPAGRWALGGVLMAKRRNERDQLISPIIRRQRQHFPASPLPTTVPVSMFRGGAVPSAPC